MTLHDYICDKGHEKRDTKVHPGRCAICGLEMKVSFARWKSLNSPSPRIDNHIFNNGHGLYDEGLGEVIFSRKHRRQVMKDKNLEEIGSSDRDEVLKDFEVKAEDGDVIKDRLDKAEAMVKSGESKTLTAPLR